MKSTHLISEKFSTSLKKTMNDLRELKEMRLYMQARRVVNTAKKYSFSLNDLPLNSEGGVNEKK